MSEVLEVTKRELHGKLNNGRLRRSGKLPAILYGHGKEPISLMVTAEGLDATLRHGAKVVELKGAADGQALLQQIQWDTFQQHVLHVDLLRVDAKDRVTIEVSLLLRGEAPGEHEGGVVEHLVHHLEVETDPGHIPEHLHVSVNQLHLGGTLKVVDIIDLPAGAKVVGDADMVLVQCVEPTEAPEEEIAGGAEPELIGRKAEEDGEEIAEE
jgi:large subunit ribosomal protein L25